MSNIAVPTGVSAATGGGAAGTADVTYTFPAGITTVEIICRNNTTKALIKKVDSTGSVQSVSGLGTAVGVEFEVRGIASDGRIGQSAAFVTATSHA